MKYQNALKWLLGFAMLATGTMANAVIITFDSVLDGDLVPTTNVAGATVIDFNGGSCDGLGAYASCAGDFAVVDGDQSGIYAAPAIGGGNDDPTSYVTVPLNLPGTTSATFTLGTTANYFGLLWGSIDDYNTIQFLLSGMAVATYTGSQVINPSAANGNQTAPSTNTYVNFFDLPTFNEVKFASDQYAFESDNHAYATVPEPGTLALLGAGLIGLGVVRRRKAAA